MKIKYFDVPILLIVYNRPSTTRRVFSAIRNVKPSKLFIVADGPKHKIEKDSKKCDETRKITEAINWKCDVKRLYRNRNLGCKHGVVSAINWFFDNVDEGILLEDDCLPGRDFFVFCEQMLNKYRNDNVIMHIGGDNYQNARHKKSNSYYFSKYSQTWGWATWKRAWKEFDPEMKDWPEVRKQNKIGYIFDSMLERYYWYSIFDLVSKKIYFDVWDYQWQYACWKNGALSILPGVNLIENIGFGKNATHTMKDSLKLRRNIEKMSFPLLVPDKEIRDVEKDKVDTKNVFGVNVPTVLFLKKLYFLNKLGIG